MSFSHESIFDPLPPIISLEDDAYFEHEASPEVDLSSLQFVPRSRNLWVPLLIPIVLCGLSFAGGGIQPLTDMGFAALTVICSIYLFQEIRRFPQRCGIGGILVFGGALVWFCHDYMVNWFGIDANAPTIITGGTLDVLAKTAFFYSVFVLFMAVGLRLPAWNRFEGVLASIPEPASPNIYLAIVLAMLAIGWSSFIFTAESLPISLMKGAFGPWMHDEVHWTATRTGNYNTNWSAYVSNFIEIGLLGGVVAAMYAEFIARTFTTRVLGWAIWFYWILFAYGTGRRGPLTSLAFPALAFLYLKYQSRMLISGKRHNYKGIVVVGSLGLLLLLVVQIQGSFRGAGLGDEVDVSKVELTKSQGNRMFSEALVGFNAIPNFIPFFNNRFPGEGAIRAMPETAFWFVVGPIPRALWPTKPSDDAMVWYNRTIAGTNGMEGTTISQGIVGHWYFRYGFFGIVEGGMLIGWLMGATERMLYSANGRPMTILGAFCLAAWLFRIYRNFYFIDLYGPLIAVLVFALFVRISRVFGGEPAPTISGGERHS